MKELPVFELYFLTFQGAQCQPLLGDVFTLSPQVFSFAATESIEKILKVSIALVEPMKLGGESLWHAGIGKSLRVFLIDKQQVPA